MESEQDYTSVPPSERWQQLLPGIGGLVVAAGQLEQTVHDVLLNLMGGNDWRRTGLVIEGYTAGQMRHRCERLAHLVLADDLQADVLRWLKRAEKAQGMRNLIVHSSWADKSLLSDGQAIGPAATSQKPDRRAPHGLQRTTVAYTPGELRDATGACTQAMIDGTRLQMELQQWAEAERRQGCADLSPWTRPVPDLDLYG